MVVRVKKINGKWTTKENKKRNNIMKINQMEKKEKQTNMEILLHPEKKNI